MIDPYPSFGRCVASANLSDISRFAFWSVFGATLGYVTSRPAIPRIQRFNGICGLLVGGSGGFILMAMRSEQRLMGKRE